MKLLKSSTMAGLGAVCAMAMFAAVVAVPVHAGQTAGSDLENTVITKHRMNTKSAPRHANSNAVTRSVRVSIRDLDLSRDAGITALYGRLKMAAHTVCSPEESRNLAVRRDWAQCYDTALDNSVADARNPGLVEHHLAQTGRTVGSESRVAGTQ